MDDRECPDCGWFYVSDDEDDCPECGSFVPKHCPFCGSEYDQREEEFCPTCGCKIAAYPKKIYLKDVIRSGSTPVPPAETTNEPAASQQSARPNTSFPWKLLIIAILVWLVYFFS